MRFLRSWWSTLAALVLVVGVVLSPLRAMEATIPVLFAYDAAVGPSPTTVLGGQDAVRPKAEPPGINDYDGARLAYIGVLSPYGAAGVGEATAYGSAPNPYGAAGAGAALAYDRILNLVDRREAGEGVIYATHAATTAAEGGETVLYRIITNAEPEANFVSNVAKGLAPRGPEAANPLIHNGLSMFDSLEGAAAKVPIIQRGGGTVLGIGEVRIPAGAADVSIAKTLGAGHYTVTGAPGAVQGYWNFSWLNW